MQSIVIRIKRQGTIHSWKKNSNGKIECPYCDVYTAKKGSTMSEHVRRIHPEEAGRPVLPFHCTYCSKKYQVKTELNNHIRDFHEIVRVECPECDYSAKNKYALYPHYSAKHMPISTQLTADGEEQCIYCCKIMTKMAAKSHVAKCYEESPFYSGHS